ncbi:MAG: MBL fold metallo-hydrolase [Actinomycetota bacterium]|nr:MBL fold metallo-hydrolase [Actinomycetota bacterium]
MRVRIHRGAHEIGGNCVEVEHEAQRIVLDVGRPLTADRGEIVPLPDIAGLTDGDSSMLGVLISHHHADHWGLIDQVRAGLPIFMGEATQAILKAAAFWTWGLDVPVAGHLRHRETFEIGPFTVTAYLNDHSAFDAYSLLVEAGGKRLFYTGDIRGHGRKAGIFQELLRKPPTGVDVLLMEGTNLQPGMPTKPTATETDVEAAMAERFRDTDGIALVVSSAQNIDRLVTIYRACLRADRDLVINPYTADIARATGNDNIPRPSPEWDRVHVYMPRWQAVRIKQREAFERLDDINPYRLFEEHLAEDASRYVLLFSASDGPRLAQSGALNDATCTWSLWTGYLEESSGQRLTAFLADHEIPLEEHHTSGHASVADLRRLAEAIDPGRVVPIHTFGGTDYESIYPTIDVQPDGAWWEV